MSAEREMSDVREAVILAMEEIRDDSVRIVRACERVLEALKH